MPGDLEKVHFTNIYQISPFLYRQYTMKILPDFLTYRMCTVCPGSSDPFYIVSYYIKWVTTSWTYSMVYKHRLISVHGV